jgi:Flp pilus assembly protein TadG
MSRDMVRAIHQRVRRLQHDRRGVAALEFSIIGLLMVTFMLAAYDLGNAAQQQVALQQAVRTGGQYALSYPTNPTGVRTAVLRALPASWTLSDPGGVPSVTCTCAGATVSCSSPGNCTPPFLVTITATMPYQALTPLFAAAIPFNRATYVTRIQ